jgi:mono/diheme cytochrome c family protein
MRCERLDDPLAARRKRDSVQPQEMVEGPRFPLLVLILTILAGCSANGRDVHEANGQALFQFHCAPCHETPPPDLLKEPPKLNGIFNSKTLPSGSPATDEQVRKVIIEGLRTMPAFDKRLKEDEVRDLIAYLHTLR